MDGREITLNDTSFVVGTTIGSGRFGKVKTAKRISDGTVVALKITDPLEARKNFRREVGALKTLSGLPSIVEYVDHGEGVLYPKTRGRTPIYRDVLAIKLAKHGELYPFLLINEEPCPLPEPVARALFLELVTGLESMHRSRVAHRDIKLQNILLDEGYHLILTDFGLASPPQSPEREASFQGSSGGWKMESGKKKQALAALPPLPLPPMGLTARGQVKRPRVTPLLLAASAQETTPLRQRMKKGLQVCSCTPLWAQGGIRLRRCFITSPMMASRLMCGVLVWCCSTS